MKYKSILVSPWLLQSPVPFQDLLVNMVKIQRSFSYFFIYWFTHLYTSINACVHSLRRASGQDKQDKPSQAKPHKLKFLNLCPTKSLAHSKLVPTENQVQDKLSLNCKRNHHSPKDDLPVCMYIIYIYMHIHLSAYTFPSSQGTKGSS